MLTCQCEHESEGLSWSTVSHIPESLNLAFELAVLPPEICKEVEVKCHDEKPRFQSRKAGLSGWKH